MILLAFLVGLVALGVIYLVLQGVGWILSLFDRSIDDSTDRLAFGFLFVGVLFITLLLGVAILTSLGIY